MKIQFEWDADNAATHLQKHKISFETAVRVFTDPFAMTAQDRIENGEQRWQTIGMVDGHLVLLVAHTLASSEDTEESPNTEIIRIISARKADKKERKRYENTPR
jgi:uncharacterized protein